MSKRVTVFLMFVQTQIETKNPTTIVVDDDDGAKEVKEATKYNWFLSPFVL